MMPNRIQKLLFSEYSDFEDMVLVESPFAEITRSGDGIRQVHLGLTPRNLVVAADVIRPVDEVETLQWAGVDPEIESFELVSVFPVELVNLSIFRRSRHTLKAHFCNKKIKFYELGGGDRKVLWRLWCERVRFLRGRLEASSRSETSVSSSTSASTAYVVASSLALADDGRPQLWERYCSTQQVTARRWEDRNLYLGSRFELTPLGPLLPSSSSEGPSWTRSQRSPLVACRCAGHGGDICHLPGAECKCGGVVSAAAGPSPGAGPGPGPGPSAGVGAGVCAAGGDSLHQDVRRPPPGLRGQELQRRRRRAGRRVGVGVAAAPPPPRAMSQPAPNASSVSSGAAAATAVGARGGGRGGAKRRWHLVNRFAQGVSENCGLGLWLDERHYELDEPWSKLREEAMERRRRSEFGAPCCGYGGGGGGGGAAAMTSSGGLGAEGPGPALEELLPGGPVEAQRLAEGGVQAWERGRSPGHRHGRTRDQPRRHWRRFALAPRPLYLRGVGPWAAQPGDAAGAAGVRRRALSATAVLRQPLEAELCPPLPRAQLAASVSCDALLSAPPDTDLPGRRGRRRQRRVAASLTHLSAQRLAHGPPLLFWTARYWYRPFPRSATYHCLQRHLLALRHLHERMAVGRSSASPQRRLVAAAAAKGPGGVRRPLSRSPARSALVNLQRLLVPGRAWSGEGEGVVGDLQALRRALRRPQRGLNVWVFDSATLAEQLTLIDKELLLQVPAEELRGVWRRRSSKASPRLRALLAFAHRVACLVASEVLRVDALPVRARLISRFIAVANKCHRLQNFQSCHSVLAGLQSVPIHRLSRTWGYMRWKHASKYSLFERLCRKYRDPRMPTYQRTFSQATLQPPFMPFVGDILTHLFGYLPETVETYKEFSFCENRILCSLLPCPIHGCTSSRNKRKLQRNDSSKIHNENNLEDNNDSKLGKNLKGHCALDATCTCLEQGPLTINELSFLFLCEATNFLKECQLSVQKYMIKPNFQTREYLLKARYQEDFDNYVRSVVLEDKQIYNIS